MPSNINRRGFVGAAVASGAISIVPRSVLGGAGYVAPSEKVTLAHIGMGTQGFRELGGLLDAPEIQIVAVCDPNRDSSDYIEWGKGGIRNTLRKYLGNRTWRENDNGCPAAERSAVKSLTPTTPTNEGPKNSRPVLPTRTFVNCWTRKRTSTPSR